MELGCVPFPSISGKPDSTSLEAGTNSRDIMKNLTRRAASIKATTVIFGAFDRHNFGDLLFAHIAGALLGWRNSLYAGLADTDLRPAGGHLVSAIGRLPQRLPCRRFGVFHVGGELLTCSAWQAAVMLLPPASAGLVVARLEPCLQAQRAWARSQIGIDDLAPYTVAASRLPCPAHVVYAGVGGVGLDRCDAALRAEVLAKLAAADAIGVRDAQTAAVLQAASIRSRLMPDPAALTAALFSRKISRYSHSDGPAAARKAFPQGYVAVQFSDDLTLASISAALDQVARTHRCGIVFFRAGAAPWHDDLDCYRRAAAMMHEPSLLMHSPNPWAICALIAGSIAYLGSSLHGRIIAMAYALPRLSLLLPGEPSEHSKLAAYAATWENSDMPGALTISDSPAALAVAMGSSTCSRRRQADALASVCMREYLALTKALG
jgi:hypothetical protein